MGLLFFCVDLATFWQCKHHCFCYVLLFEQSRRWKKHNRKRLQKLPKGEPKDLSNWLDWRFHRGLYNDKYPNQEEFDYHDMCLICMVICAAMCVLFTLGVCGALIGFGTIFAGVYKFWCSASEILWYNLHHIEELPLNIWFYIAIAGCAVLLVLVLISIYNNVKQVVKKS